GLAHGKMTQRYPSGQKFQELHLDCGKPSGTGRQWFPDGRLMLEKNHLADGRVTVTMPDGTRHTTTADQLCKVLVAVDADRRLEDEDLPPPTDQSHLWVFGFYAEAGRFACNERRFNDAEHALTCVLQSVRAAAAELRGLGAAAECPDPVAATRSRRALQR